MAVFHAFRALRPTPEKAADVAALPYDVVNREEAKSIGDENPLSFLHIDRPEMDLEPETDLPITSPSFAVAAISRATCSFASRLMMESDHCRCFIR